MLHVDAAPSPQSTDLGRQAALLGARVTACGPTTIIWLPADFELTDTSLRETLTADELGRAKSFAAPSRRAEYQRTRWLIRCLTGHSGELPSKKSREPTWPPGWVGSISHKNGLVAVALAHAQVTASVGIDVERADGLREALAPKIVTPAESSLLDQGMALALTKLSSPQGGLPTRSRVLSLAFSFKEAIFKCCFPLGQTMFYFHDAEITALDWQNGKITARLLCDASRHTPKGSLLEGYFTWLEPAEGEHMVISSVELARC